MASKKSWLGKATLFVNTRRMMRTFYVGSTKSPDRFLFVLGAFVVVAFLVGSFVIPLAARLPGSPPSPDGKGGGNGGGNGGDGDGDKDDEDKGGDDKGGNDDQGGDGGGTGGDGGNGNDDSGGNAGGGGSDGGGSGAFGCPEPNPSGFRCLSVTGQPIEAQKPFAIEVMCDRSFQVIAIYALAKSQDTNFNIIYEQVRAKGDFAGTGIIFWTVASSIWDPSDGQDSLVPYELTSHMSVDPIGIPGDGVFLVEGEVQSAIDGSLSVGVVLTTGGAGGCKVLVVP